MPRSAKRWRRPPSFWDEDQRYYDIGRSLEDLELARDWFEYQTEKIKKQLEEKKKDGDKEKEKGKDGEWVFYPKRKPKQFSFGETFAAILFFGPPVAIGYYYLVSMVVSHLK